MPNNHFLLFGLESGRLGQRQLGPSANASNLSDSAADLCAVLCLKVCPVMAMDCHTYERTAIQTWIDRMKAGERP